MSNMRLFPVLIFAQLPFAAAFIVSGTWKGRQGGQSCRFSEERVARTEATSLEQHDNHREPAIYQELCRALGMQHGATFLQSTETGMRGVHVATPVAQGDAIMQIPISDKWFRDDDSPIPTQQDDNNTPYSSNRWASRLAAAFLQRQAAPDATFQLYSSLLPDPELLAASLPVNWDSDILTFAGSTALELYVDSGFFTRAETVEEVLVRITNLTREQALFAIDVVQTRSCRLTFPDGRDVRCLVPVFDFINHSNKPNAEFSLQGETLLVTALCDLERNEQVFIDYGASARPAARCLASYGFVPEFYPEDESAAAEIYLDGVRYEVGTSSIPEGMVSALMVDDQQTNLSDKAVLTPEIASRLAQRLTDVSFQLLLNPLEGKQDDDSAPGLLSAHLAKSLRWYQHRVLDACSAGLKEWAAERTHEQQLV